MTVDEVLEFIREGGMDKRFDELREAIGVRRNYLDAVALTEWRVGDRAMAPMDTSPKHRRGKVGTIEKIDPRSGRVHIRFDDSDRRREGAWRWPAALLVKVDDEAMVDWLKRAGS